MIDNVLGFLLVSIGSIVGFCFIIWILYGIPVRALMKDLENENLKLRIKLEEIKEGEKWKKKEN